MPILSLALSAIVGACAGYVTNDIALLLMFSGIQIKDKTIDPLITRSKEELAGSLGDLVQDKLMEAPAGKPESLLFEKLQQETFTSALQAALADFLSTALPQQLDQLEYAAIPGYETAVAQIQELLQGAMEQHAPALLASLTEQLPLTDFLSVRQQQAIGEHLLETLAQTLTPGTLETFAASLVGGSQETTSPPVDGGTPAYPDSDKPNSDKPQSDRSDSDRPSPCVADILGEAETAQLRESLIQNGMDALFADLRADPEKRQEWKARIQALLETANGTHALATALRQAAEQPLSQLLGSDTIAKWVDYTRPLLRNFTQTEAFGHILRALAEQIRAALCELPIPLYRICPEQVRNQLGEYLSRRLPDAIPYLSEYLQSRRNTIEQMIEREVDAVIDENTSNWFWANGMRNWFREEIRNAIYEVDVVKKMEDYVKEFLQSEDRETFGREQLTSLLKNNTVADIASRFLSVDTLCGWLHQGCAAFLDHLPDTVYEKIGAIRLAALLGEDKLTALTQSAAQTLTKETAAVLVERVLCPAAAAPDDTEAGAVPSDSQPPDPGSRLRCQLQAQLQTQTDQLLHTPIRQWLPTDTLSSWSLSQKVQAAVSAHKGELVKRVRPAIEQRFISERSVGSVLRNHMDSLAHVLAQKGAAAWQSLTTSIAHSKPAASLQYWKTKFVGQKGREPDTPHPSEPNQLRKPARWLQQHIVPLLVHRLSARQLVVNKIMGMPNAWIGAQMREFVGKELRPLCILGAILGLVIAVIWELAMGSHMTSLIPHALAYALIGAQIGELRGKKWWPPCLLGALAGTLIAVVGECAVGASVMSFLSRALAYASIGMITNWLAFFGLFHPYKRTPVGWIPGFSYIPKRIPQIAESFGELISRHLLDEDSIRLQLTGHKEHLCAVCVDQLTQDNGAAWGKLLQERQSQWVPALTEAVQSLMEQHADEWAAWLRRTLVEPHTLGDVLPSTLCDGAGESLTAWLAQQLTPEVSRALVAALPDAARTSSLYDWQLFTPETIHQRVHMAVTTHLPPFCDQFLHFDTVREMVARQQQKETGATWRTQSLQTFLEALPSVHPEQFADVAQKISDWAAAQLLSPKAGDAIYARIDRFLQQQFQSQDTIGTCLDGSLRRWLDHSFDSIMQTLLQWLLRYIQNREEEITQSVIDKVNESVSLVPRMLIDADDLVRETLARLIQRELPAFFREEKQYITQVGRWLLKREVYPIPLASLQADVKQWELKPLLSYVLSSHALRQRVQEATDALCPVLLQEVLQQPLGTIADWAQIDTLTDLCDRFRPSITLALDELRHSTQDTPAVAAQATSFLCAVLDQHIFRRPFGELLAWCPSETLAATGLHIGQYLLQQPETPALLQTLTDRAYAACAVQPLAAMLDVTDLQRSLGALLRQPARFTETLQQGFQQIGQELGSEPLRVLPPATQQWVAATLVQALWNTLDWHMTDLLHAVDIRDITTQVISSLDGRGVHLMFKGFASRYFDQLILLGAIGVVFCVPGVPASVVYTLLSGWYLLQGQPKSEIPQPESDTPKH